MARSKFWGPLVPIGSEADTATGIYLLLIVVCIAIDAIAPLRMLHGHGRHGMNGVTVQSTLE